MLKKVQGTFKYYAAGFPKILGIFSCLPSVSARSAQALTPHPSIICYLNTWMRIAGINADSAQRVLLRHAMPVDWTDQLRIEPATLIHNGTTKPKFTLVKIVTEEYGRHYS